MRTDKTIVALVFAATLLLVFAVLQSFGDEPTIEQRVERLEAAVLRIHQSTALPILNPDPGPTPDPDPIDPPPVSTAKIELEKIGTFSLPQARGDGYERFGYSEGRIAWGEGKLWCSAHAYAVGKAKAMSVPPDFPDSPVIINPTWRDLTAPNTESLIAQIPGTAAKTMGGFAFKGETPVVVYRSVYNTASINHPWLAFGSNGLFKTEHTNNAIAEYVCIDGNQLLCGASKVAGQGSGSYGPAIYSVTFESGKPVSTEIVFHAETDPFPDHNACSNWQGIAVVNNLIVLVGYLPIGKCIYKHPELGTPCFGESGGYWADGGYTPTMLVY